MTLIENASRKIISFKDLIAWQKAYRLSLDIYKHTSFFPNCELFGLTAQLKRCAVSVPSNIAEGFSRHSPGDYARFLYIAYSSLSEIETQLLLAADLNYINVSQRDGLLSSVQEVQKLIYGLIKSLKNCKNSA